MQVTTILFGSMEVGEENLLHMSRGPFGFEEILSYALIEKQDEDVTLRWLQAVDDTMPCFVVFDPFELVNGYDPAVDPQDLRALGCESREELRYFVIAVVPEDISQATVNLKSPIVVNPASRQGAQVILQNDYPIRFSLAGAAE